MATKGSNQFIDYPVIVDKANNGGYVVKDPNDPTKFYAFSTQADMTYWLGLNEQKPATPQPPAAPSGTVNVTVP